jgi:hypothetical protein
MLSALNFIALRLLWLLFPAGYGIVAEHNVPDELPIGEPVAVHWAIHKGSLEGFAKLTFDLPALLDVSVRNANGATFSFENGQAKLIWMDMPSDATLAVGLDLEALPGFEGGAISPTFSFVRDGDRVDLALEGAVVRADAATLPQGLAYYHGTRTVDPKADGTFQVQIHVTCEPTKGFLKLEETLPAGCKPESIEPAGATTSVLNGALKFVWFEAPDVQSFDLAYNLRCENPAAARFPWQGQIAYVSEDEPVLKPIVATAEESFADNGQQDENSDRLTADEPFVTKKEDGGQSLEPSQNEVAQDVAFRVQVMAAHRYVDGEWMRGRFGLKEAVDVEEQSDWFKYTVGQADAYADARNLREQLAAGYNFPGPFVTAYLRGERITVQEALALSDQQWIP